MSMLVGVLVLGSFNLLAHARFKALGEADWAVKLYDERCKVSRDASSVCVLKEVIELRTEGARSSLGTMSWQYNSQTTEFELLQAETRFEGQTFPVTPSMVEDKSVATNVQGFDEMKQITIAFPQVRVGAQLYLEVRWTVAAPTTNVFSRGDQLGEGGPWENVRIEYRSELPLHVEHVDPTKQMKVNTSRRKRTHLVAMSLKGPVYFDTTEAGEYLTFRQRPYFGVSTLESYAELPRGLQEAYQKVLGAPIPASLQKIVDSAPKNAGVIDTANFITSQLADQYRYMGDWRSTDGASVPRSIKEIERTRYGDCKDLSALTVILLRRLGFDAHVAWIKRGGYPTPLPRVPQESSFDHAVVFVEREGKDYWIDPSNARSFAQGIPEDLYAREALVLSWPTPKLVRVPVPSPDDNTASTVARREMTRGNNGRVRVEQQVTGGMALPFTAWELYQSKEVIDKTIAEVYAKRRQIISYEVHDYDFTSRIVRDGSVGLEGEFADEFIQTGRGPAYLVTTPELDRLRQVEPGKTGGHYYLGPPLVRRSVDYIENARLRGKTPKRCSASSPWLEAFREIVPEGNAVVIREEVRQKTLTIPSSELRSASFKSFQASLRDCFADVAVEFSPVDP